MPSSMAKSIAFDINLLRDGSWSGDQRRLIETWIKEDEFEEKRALASQVISVMIPNLLDSDCSPGGRIKSTRLGEMLQHFEDLLTTAKAGFAKKFYRDHLNHMLRVMLLSNAIGNRVKALSLSNEDVRLLVLAGLVHDIAYPLAESYHIFNDTIKAMRKCYSALDFPNLLTSYNMVRVTNLIEKLNLADMPVSSFGPLLEKNNHGLMGAIEFSDYLDQEILEKYSHLLQIMVFHDSSLSVPESLRKDKLLMALVLSDEIQDWGRPASFDKEPAISELKDFEIEPQRIHCTYTWERGVNVSPIRQIHAKVLNFRRFEWPSILEVDLLFKLQNYYVFDTEKLDVILGKAVEYCKRKSPETLEKLSKDWAHKGPFEESYYGKSLPKTDDLLKYISDSRALPQNSLHFDSQWNELLHVDREFGRLDSLEIKIKSGAIGLVLCGEKMESKGQLLFKQSIAQTITEQIVARLVTFYRLITDIALQNAEKTFGPQAFPSTELVKKGLQTIGVEGEIDPLIENLRSLRRCIVAEGLFAFKSET